MLYILAGRKSLNPCILTKFRHFISILEVVYITTVKNISLLLLLQLLFCLVIIVVYCGFFLPTLFSPCCYLLSFVGVVFGVVCDLVNGYDLLLNVSLLSSAILYAFEEALV